MITLEEIKTFTSRIAEEFHPDRIILFGSYAYGSPSPDSDVDILVILPFEGKSWRMASLIRKRVHPPFPADILARTPAQVQDRMQRGDCFLREITERGEVLYER